MIKFVVDSSSVRPELESKKRLISNLKNKALSQATFFTEAEVKESIAGRRAETRSVDTGQFLNSVKSRVDEEEGVVSSDVQHALFMEYGTSRIKERRHFRNTKSRNEEKIRKYFEDSIKKASDK